MKKYQFQKRILLRSIFIMLILFIILTMVFSSYVIKTSTAEFEEQIDVQLRGITVFLSPQGFHKGSFYITPVTFCIVKKIYSLLQQCICSINHTDHIFVSRIYNRTVHTGLLQKGIAATQDLALGLSIQIGVSDTSCTRSIIHFKVSTSTSSSTDAHTSKNVAPASDCILALSLIRSASFSYFLLHIYYLPVKKFTEKNCRQIFSFDSSLNITHITIIFTIILISQFPSYSEASISQPPVPQWHPFPQKYLSSIWNPYCDYDCPLT